MLVKENLLPTKSSNWNMGHDSDGQKTITKFGGYTEIDIKNYGSQWNYFSFGMGNLINLNNYRNETITVSLDIKCSIDTRLNNLTLCKTTSKDIILENSNFAEENLNANKLKRITASGQKNDLEVTSQVVYLSIRKEDMSSKYTLFSPMINLGDKAADLWIPAKADLNKSNLYPQNGEYTEIKAIWKEKKWQRE